MRIRTRDIGIFPLMLSLPFMYYPKVLGGDTQPWIFFAALIAFFTFRTKTFIRKQDFLLIILALLSILAYAFRSKFGFGFLRHTYTFLSFVIFWVVCQREKDEYFPFAVKITVVLWFFVGLYQYLAINMGYQIETSGRMLVGRMGPPSMTAEASYYGSISVLQLMYLMSEKESKNSIFIACAVASVVMSGSLLALILLLFPLMKLVLKFRISAVLILAMLVVGDVFFASSQVTSRFNEITSSGMNISSLLFDPSLNLRTGHIYFTLVENFFTSLLLIEPIDFMAQYNRFAQQSGLFINTGSNYILPAIGEMIYGSGILAVMILLIIFKRTEETCSTIKAKVEKIGFIMACMMSPISISNIFLILFVVRRDSTTDEGHYHRSVRPGWLLCCRVAVKQRIRRFGVDL